MYTGRWYRVYGECMVCIVCGHGIYLYRRGARVRVCLHIPPSACVYPPCYILVWGCRVMSFIVYPFIIRVVQTLSVCLYEGPPLLAHAQTCVICTRMPFYYYYYYWWLFLYLLLTKNDYRSNYLFDLFKRLQSALYIHIQVCMSIVCGRVGASSRISKRYPRSDGR